MSVYNGLPPKSDKIPSLEKTMAEDTIVSEPAVDPGLADADLGGLSDIAVLDKIAGDALAAKNEPAAATDTPVVEDKPADATPVSETKPEVKPEVEAKPEDKADESEPDEGTEGVSIKKLQDLTKASPEFKALLDKNPGLRNQLFVTARRAERSSQYDELFQTPTLAKEAKIAADEHFSHQQFYNGRTPEDADKFWRLMQWQDLVKDEKGQPKVDPQTGRYESYGNYDHHTAHYRMAVYASAENMASQLEQDGKTFKDASGQEVSADDLRTAVHILRAATNGVPIPTGMFQTPAGEAAAQPGQQAAPKQQLPTHLQKELDDLRAKDRQNKQTDAQTAESFKADVETQRVAAVETDIRNLLAKRLPANVGISDYMRDMIVRDTAAEINRLAKGNLAHQHQVTRATTAAPRTADGAKSVVAITQAFAKELIPQTLSRVISKAVPGITASNVNAQKKVAAQVTSSGKEVRSSGGVSTPTRPDARQVAKDIEAKAKKDGKPVSDMDVLEGIMQGVHGR